MDEVPLLPVVEWEIKGIAAMDAIIIRLGFLTHESQKPEERDPGRWYALTPARARELADGIHGALRALESAGPTQPPGTRQ
jgi:hypothetical protein